MNTKRKKYLFNLIGGGVIIFWLVMIGLLVKKTSFNDSGEHSDFVTNKISGLKGPQRDWMEIYLKGNKVGYSVSLISPLEEGYLIQEDIFLKLNLMGQASVIHTVTQSVVDHEFFLKNFRFKMDSGVVTFQVSGKVKDNKLMILEIGKGRSRRSESIKLKGRPVIGSGMAHFFKGRLLEVGQSFRFPVFDPSTMAQKEMVIKVMTRETLVINRIQYRALRLVTEMWGQPMTFWLDDEGAVLKEEGFMGFTLVKSSSANAPRDIEGGEDFYKLSAVQVKRKLQNPDRLVYLKLKVKGLDETHFDTGILNKGRQSFRGETIEIVREKTPLISQYTLPYPDRSGRMKPFLQAEINIESDDRAIMEKAREIARDARDPVTVAKRLMAWVYRNVKKRPVVSVPSALEVLKARVGDCNEHAALLTALLRASGIPSRLCVGLVYTRGMFFYHAWCESYVGDLPARGSHSMPGKARQAGWISMDPTLNQMPVDATHIKLVQGGLERQVEIIGLIGKLRLEVIDYRYE